ncbi:MAG: hypothetical protein EPO07_04285 [Verrucomicrobia bacterium]|nr:MAG: hypothetical protein EPO07_04285 [Verrucomicrobiota bacterium]
MKRAIMRVLACAVVVLVALCLFAGERKQTATTPDASASNSLQPHAKFPESRPTNMAALPLRNQMSREERLNWLEKNGEVPEDADDTDWHLAQQATWWGKQLNRAEFWKDRVVWFSVSARKAARRHGRFYPPIPYEDPKFFGLSTNDVASSSSVVLGSYLDYHQSDREAAFWDYFVKTHPMPPDEIEREQQRAAKEFYGTGKLVNLNSNDVEQIKAFIRSDPLKRNYPAEAFTEEALFWTYVMKQRNEYTTQIVPFAAANASVLTNWIGRQTVKPSLLTEPLTDEQLRAANSWKISYLQRLRREKADESYINAYLKSWNLSPEMVFSAAKEP